MKKIIATTTMMALLISSNINAQQYNEPSMTSLKQKVDQWAKDIKEALIIFKGLNASQAKKKASLNKTIKDLDECGKVTDKNGELSIEVIKAIELTIRQADYCEKYAVEADPEYSEGYRRGAQICRKRAANMERLLKEIHEKNARFKGLMVDFKKHKVFYLDMLVIGQIGLANEHLKKVSQSMDAVVQEVESLSTMKQKLVQISAPSQR